VDLDHIKQKVLDKRSRTPVARTTLVGISGVDASGKGYIAERLAKAIGLAGPRVALINIDRWLDLPNVRFPELANTTDNTRDSKSAGSHFYNHGIRLDKAFEQLILPLKRDRKIDITADLTDETAKEFRSHRYDFRNIDIVIVEGIFLFKRHFVPHFDLKIWIECSFETALSRAVARKQEGLDAESTIAAYETIYFPAQCYHFDLDQPRTTADIIVRNE
jgi:uridine kinase